MPTRSKVMDGSEGMGSKPARQGPGGVSPRLVKALKTGGKLAAEEAAMAAFPAARLAKVIKQAAKVKIKPKGKKVLAKMTRQAAKSRVGKAAASAAKRLNIEEYAGTVGNKQHLTRSVEGEVPIEGLLSIKGGMGEHSAFIWNPSTKSYRRNPASKHANRYSDSPDAPDYKRWSALVDDIRKNGVKKPIVIFRDPDKKALIYEGNHRLRAAREAGLKNIPVKIRYFGHSERAGLVPGDPGK